MKDLFGALAGLALLVMLLAGLARACSFSPGGPDDTAATRPRVDAAAQLSEAAAQVSFPLVVPRLPAGWQANSAMVAPVGQQQARAVRVGWLTPGGRYLRLSQSAAAEETLVSAETGTAPEASGAVQVDGVTWAVYASIRDERAWVADRNGVRLLITGSGTEPEFRALARAAQSGASPP